MTPNEPTSLNLLGFTGAERETSYPPTGSRITQRAVSYEDFTIDGMPVFDLLFINHKPDNVTAFDRAWPQFAVEVAEELLGVRKPELDDGRVALYVCGECGDLGCGALTAEIIRTDETVTWRNFGWQNNYEQGWEVGDYEHLRDTGPFVFGSDQYESVLTATRDRYAAMPPGRPAPVLPTPLSLFARLLSKFK